MSQFPDKPVDAFAIFDYAVRRHFALFKQSFLLIVLITLAQAFMVYLGHLFSQTFINALFQWIGFILFLYFAGALLYQAQNLLEQEQLSFSDTLRGMLNRCLPFFLGVLFIAAVVILYYLLITHIIQIWLSPTDIAKPSLKNMLLFIFLCLAPILIFVVFMIFVLPLIIVDELNPLAAIARSYMIIGTRWLQAFSIYACIGIIYILVSPNTLHAHFFMHYHVFIIFVFVIYCIFLPFLANYILFMMHDFKLRLDSEIDLE